MWYRRVSKVGNSLMIGLPSRMCKMLEIRGGEDLVITLENKKIVIAADNRPGELQDKMQQATKKKEGKNHGR